MNGGDRLTAYITLPVGDTESTSDQDGVWPAKRGTTKCSDGTGKVFPVLARRVEEHRRNPSGMPVSLLMHCGWLPG